VSEPANELEARLREAPEDEGAWLVYADWLLERGDVRGEVIRLSHQLDTSWVGEGIARTTELFPDFDPDSMRPARKGREESAAPVG
jgi:uncharacterized protein (TIGR02996 family)